MVTLAEAKDHIRVTWATDDAEIAAMVEASKDHLRSIDVVGIDVDPLPPALHQAVLLLVGQYFRSREATSDTAMKEIPFGVSCLIAPYRTVTL